MRAPDTVAGVAQATTQMLPFSKVAADAFPLPNKGLHTLRFVFKLCCAVASCSLRDIGAADRQGSRGPNLTNPAYDILTGV